MTRLSRAPVLRDPSLRRSMRDICSSRNGLQGLVLLKVWLDDAESIQRQLSDIFWQTGKGSILEGYAK
jgi:hypothetical protein